MGTFSLINFGFYFAINALITVKLQMSDKECGYGFSPQQYAACKFNALDYQQTFPKLIRFFYC